jgi:hypothetical protein
MLCVLSGSVVNGFPNPMKRFKKIPPFKDEDAERAFWSKADSTEYIDWSKAQKLVLPDFLAEKIKQERAGKR